MGSLPTRGAWIEISRPQGIPMQGRSLPTRGAWIEITTTITGSRVSRSLPTRGAWIEMPGRWSSLQTSPGRSPHGERGLKSHGQVFVGEAGESLPTRGAWIEIHETSEKPI